MNTRILSICLAAVGQILIVVLFFVALPLLEPSIFWLDLVVASTVYWILAYNFIGPSMIDLKDGAGARGASLGISWLGQGLYIIAAIGFMVVNIVMYPGLSFVWQLIVQCGLLFLFGIVVLTAMHTTEKVGQVYADEQRTMQGKRDIRFALTDLSDIAAAYPAIPAGLRGELRHLAEESRYLTPCSSYEAHTIEGRIIHTAEALRPALSAYDLNAPAIEARIAELGRLLQQRKRCMA